MDLVYNPLRKGLLALNLKDSIKFLHLDTSIDVEDGILISNDFSLSEVPMPDLPQHVDTYNVNCMAWCCFGKSTTPNSLAVGLENQGVYLVSPSYPNTVHLYQAARPCKAMCWNKLQPEWLALGFDRSRSECSLIIMNLLHEKPRRENVAVHLDSKIKGQALESCFSEAVNSVVWSLKDPKSLVAGVNGKYLRLYDTRTMRVPTQVVNTKSVYGLCQDPCLDTRFASFLENQVTVWDLRSFSKPATTISSNYGVVKADWCPTRSGLLAVVSSGSNEGHIVRVYDTSHAVVTDNDSDIVYRSVEQIVKIPLNTEEKIGTISWLPDSETRLLVMTNLGRLHRSKIPEKISVCWTNQSELYTACKDIRHCLGKQNFVSEVACSPGIQQIMFERSKNGYGLDQTKDFGSPQVNLEPDNARLSLFWKWIKLAKQSFPISVTQDMKPSFSNSGRPPWGRSISNNSVLNSRFCGLQKELKQSGSSVVPTPWIGVPDSSCTVFCSPHRKRALDMCGWYSIEILRMDPLEFKRSLVNLNDVERAAALALWHLDMQLAIDILQRHGSGDSLVQYSVIAMAFSGYIANGAAPLWQEMCDNLQRNMPNPYLRASFAFLKALKEPKVDFGAILRMRELRVSDRIGLACVFLNDENLSDVMDELSIDAAKNGHLDGIIATGLTTDLGINLIQAYVEKTKDVQTAALALIQGGSSEIIRNYKANFIIDGYRKLLDLWQLWKERAWFDTVLGKPNSSQKSKHSFHGVSVQCNFCGRGITHAKLPDMRGRGISIQGAGAMSKPTSCPKCRKPLPRCSVCCMGLGTAQADSENDDPIRDNSILLNSFMWCPFCQHGGHKQHLKEWFKEHSDCPVSGCSCDCLISHSRN